MVIYHPRSHITPTVLVEVKSPEHPEYRRVIELPRGCSPGWLARAYLLSLGIEMTLGTDPHLRLEPRTVYRPFCSDEVDDVSQTFELDQCPVPLRATVLSGRDPEVGEPRVILHETTPGTPSPLGWPSHSAQSTRDQINAEFVRLFGVVVPHYDSTVAVPLCAAIDERSLLARFAHGLTPARRLTLVDHVERHFSPASQTPLSGEGAERMLRGIRALLEAIGADGVAQDPATGWLTPAFVEDVGSRLGWPDRADAMALIDVARTMRHIRRFRGRVVRSRDAERTLSDPMSVIHKIACDVINADPRSYDSYPSAGVMVALLALADGSAAGERDLLETINAAHDVHEEHLYPSESERCYGNEYGHGYGAFTYGTRGSDVTSTSRIPADVRTVLDRLAALSGTAWRPQISLEIRALARIALTSSARCEPVLPRQQRSVE
ncbi:hypothetical protein ACI3KS_10970 [Microbacterium sp. ZW T5_45]|uniref:hypothetical protein n=1 Tax=Microbacterium sp. ZW T5_45 TaxID=3378080 RepID=UPI003852DCDB